MPSLIPVTATGSPRYSSYLQPGTIFTGKQLFSHSNPTPTPASLNTLSGFFQPRRRNVPAAAAAAAAGATSLHRTLSVIPRRGLNSSFRTETAGSAIAMDMTEDHNVTPREEPTASYASRTIADRTTKENDDEWAVKIYITSLDLESGELGGYMTALGVPTSSSPSTATCASSPLDQYLSRSSPRTVEEEGGGVGTGKMKVTTYFIGTLLDPSVPFALFSQYPPSPFSSTAPSKRDAITRARDEENWNRLGPFVGMGKEEMYEGLRDVTWCQKQCEGWMLMRWKEIDFVNVEPAESTLSIAGFYYMALNRKTGYLEGLYFDPLTTPFQRLELSARIPFGVEAFSVC